MKELSVEQKLDRLKGLKCVPTTVYSKACLDFLDKTINISLNELNGMLEILEIDIPNDTGTAFEVELAKKLNKDTGRYYNVIVRKYREVRDMETAKIRFLQGLEILENL